MTIRPQLGSLSFATCVGVGGY